MGISLKRAFRRFGEMIFAVAALFLAFGPGLDTVAKLAPADSPASSPVQLLRAFDVIDDALDYPLGHPPSIAQQHLQPPHAFPEATEVVKLHRTGSLAWRIEPDRLPESAIADRLGRPPRA